MGMGGFGYGYYVYVYLYMYNYKYKDMYMNMTIYITKANLGRFSAEPNKSGLVNRLLEEHYTGKSLESMKHPRIIKNTPKPITYTKPISPA